MTAMETSVSKKNNMGYLGCASIALLFAISSANLPIEHRNINQPQQVEIFSSQSSGIYAYNVGDNIISYYTEGYMLNTQLEENILRINEIKELPDNWNGYGAKRFSEKIISHVTNIIYNLPNQPDIYPTAQESIQLEFNNELGDYLEFEIFENETINKFILKQNGISEKYENISKDTMSRDIEAFYEQHF